MLNLCVNVKESEMGASNKVNLLIVPINNRCWYDIDTAEI